MAIATITLKDLERESERLRSENLNLKLHVQYLEELMGEHPTGMPSYVNLTSSIISTENSKVRLFCQVKNSDRLLQVLGCTRNVQRICAYSGNFQKRGKKLRPKLIIFGALKRPMAGKRAGGLPRANS